jgi:hypothetical protein
MSLWRSRHLGFSDLLGFRRRQDSLFYSAIEVSVMLSHGLTSHRVLVVKKTIDVREILYNRRRFLESRSKSTLYII